MSVVAQPGGGSRRSSRGRSFASQLFGSRWSPTQDQIKRWRLRENGRYSGHRDYFEGYGRKGVSPVVVMPIGEMPYGSAYGYGQGYGYNGCAFGCVLNGVCGSAEQCAVIRDASSVRGWIIAGSIFGAICLFCIMCVICKKKNVNSEDDYIRGEMIVEEHQGQNPIN